MMAKLIPFIVLAMLWGMIKFAFASAGTDLSVPVDQVFTSHFDPGEAELRLK